MLCTVRSLLSNSSVDCEYIIPPGTNIKLEKVDNMEFKECGKPFHLVKLLRDCLASGCYCKNNAVLNITTGLCSNYIYPPKRENKTIPLNLSEYTHYIMYIQYMN